MNDRTGMLAFGLALLALFLVLFRPVAQEQKPVKESAFERVMRTRTIRCAYITRPHHFERDAEGNRRGLDYELMEAIGKEAHLKIDWVGETGYGVFPEQLNSGKEDALCTLVWGNITRAQRVTTSAPVVFTPLYAYVRAGDARFDQKEAGNLNDDTITIAVVDGGADKAIAESNFPKARLYALPGDSDNAQAILAVAMGKADAKLSDEYIIRDYNRLNPGHELRRLPGEPVRVYSEVFALPLNEWAFRAFLDAAISEMRAKGVLDQLLAKYDPAPHAHYRATKPYEAREQP